VVVTGYERKALAAAGAAALLLVWYMHRESLPVVHIDARTLGDAQYDPFIHWRITEHADWFRPHPVSIGPNCLPDVLQSAPIGRIHAIDDQVVIDSASCAQ
jgi:hypothetical protein